MRTHNTIVHLVYECLVKFFNESSRYSGYEIRCPLYMLDDINRFMSVGSSWISIYKKGYRSTPERNGGDSATEIARGIMKSVEKAVSRGGLNVMTIVSKRGEDVWNHLSWCEYVGPAIILDFGEGFNLENSNDFVCAVEFCTLFKNLGVNYGPGGFSLAWNGIIDFGLRFRNREFCSYLISTEQVFHSVDKWMEHLFSAMEKDDEFRDIVFAISNETKSVVDSILGKASSTYRCWPKVGFSCKNLKEDSYGGKWSGRWIGAALSVVDVVFDEERILAKRKNQKRTKEIFYEIGSGEK